MEYIVGVKLWSFGAKIDDALENDDAWCKAAMKLKINRRSHAFVKTTSFGGAHALQKVG